jgi:hypothetical protein
MLLLKLSNEQAGMFDEAPEAGMGVHFARVGDELGFILSGRVAMLSEAKGRKGKEQSDALANRLWFGEHVRKFRHRFSHADPQQRYVFDDEVEGEVGGADIQEETGLIAALADAPAGLSYVSPLDPFVMAFTLNPVGYLPPTPARPPYIYGHLPFTGVAQQGDLFYRCEHWAVSRRVLAPRTIRAGTYGFPASELNFVPTGFAAVGRYALPDLPPACRRYEISPPVGYKLHCGACVPLYGQAGGGVEVMFPNAFQNSVPLTAPWVLPPL